MRRVHTHLKKKKLSIIKCKIWKTSYINNQNVVQYQSIPFN